MQLKIANAAILAYRRLSYRPWYALAEFVDNSTDAYMRKSNQANLDEEFARTKEKLTVEITYDRNEGILEIKDNSAGMNYDEFVSAMIIGEKPSESAGRSEFGMGMKTAAIWFANSIEIRTKKLFGDEEFRTSIDVTAFVDGNNDLKVHRAKKPANQHYTIVQLGDLQRKLGVSAFNKTKQYLGSIYRDDIRNGRLLLLVNGDEVSPPLVGDDVFLQRANGTPYKVTFDDIEVNGRHVSGWIGILAPGSTGRNLAGFALIRNGRAVRGWIDSWRPEEIFGDARNDLLNQRLTGELNMDAFSASHTKDAIDWESDDEEVLGLKLRDKANEFGLIVEAKKTFKSREDSEEANREKAEAQARLATQLQSKKVEDTIRLLDVPKPELAKIAGEVLIEASEEEAPFLIWRIDSTHVARLFELRLSPNDPYYEYEVLDNADLRVVINSSHPAMALLKSVESRLAHYHHVVLDAVSEWKCTQQHEPLDPSSIRRMKDQLFRSISEVDDS
jgi:hypothetical protein